MYWYVCAVVASCTAVSDPASARRLGHASLGMSIVGIVIGVIIYIVVVVIVLNQGSCLYTYNGTCYKHRTRASYYTYCLGESDGYYCYYN